MLYITEQIKLLIIEEGILKFPETSFGFLLGFEKRDIRIIEKLFICKSNLTLEQDRYQEELWQAALYAAENGLSILGIFQTLPNHPPMPQNVNSMIKHNHYSLLILSVWGGEFINLQSWRLNTQFQFVEEKIAVVNDQNYMPLEPLSNRTFNISYN